MIWAVDFTPSAPLTNFTRVARRHASRTSWEVHFFFIWTLTAWTCMIVVGTFTAIVWMFSFGRTLWTSGPWWLGISSSGSIALSGPFFESPGSVARRTITASTRSIPTWTSSGYSVRINPVVLQDGTRTKPAPRHSA